MMEAYIRMHELGYGHSVECWQEERLVGGLYGLEIDRIFFGESMFSLKNDASKIALVNLVNTCMERDIRMIDCQMTTSHMLRFGARELSREEFSECLARWIQQIEPPGPWS
jgi:leucyl/phenylalanyl-tRNA--protein transferase